MEKNTLGEIIHHLRKKAGLTQKHGRMVFAPLFLSQG